MIVTLIVLIAFYGVFMYPAKYIFTEPGLYDSIQKNFFYIPNIDNPDKTVFMPLLAGITTFLSSYLTQKTQPQPEQGGGMMNTMMIVMPLLIFYMGRNFATALVLYWIVSNVFQLVQQYITNKVVEKVKEEENVLDKNR